MFRTTAISVLAVTMALSAPGLKAQILDLDADVDLGSDGLSVDAGVDLGGSDGLSVDAGADVGGSDGVNVDADASLGGDDGLNADADVTLGGGDDGSSDDGGTIGVGVDADVSLGGSGASDGDGNGDSGAAPEGGGTLVDAEVDAALLGGGGEGGRVADLDVVIGLLENPAVDGTDIDAAIDDTRVAVIDIADTFGPEAAADIEILANANAEQQDALQAAVAASAELGSILGREGVPLETVVALDIGSDGRAAVYVLGDEEEAVASVELSLGDGTGDAAGGGTGDDGTGSDDGGNGDGGPGADGGNGGPGAGGDDGAGSDGNDGGDSTTPGAGPGALIATVAALPCPADLEAFVPEGTVDARLLGEVNAVSVIAITGCPGAMVSASAATELQATLRERSRILAAIRAEGYSVSDVVGATANDETLVVYVIGS